MIINLLGYIGIIFIFYTWFELLKSSIKKKKLGRKYMSLKKADIGEQTIITIIVCILSGVMIYMQLDIYNMQFELSKNFYVNMKNASGVTLIIIIAWLSIIIQKLYKYFLDFDVYEGGIATIDGVYKWEDIKSYKWDEEILILKVRINLITFKLYFDKRLTAEAENKESLDRYIRKNINGRRNTPNKKSASSINKKQSFISDNIQYL
jgi:hypothetical protein